MCCKSSAIQLSSFDNATSTGKHCVPKGFDPAAHIPDRYFALLRSGESKICLITLHLTSSRP